MAASRGRMSRCPLPKGPGCPGESFRQWYAGGASWLPYPKHLVTSAS